MYKKLIIISLIAANHLLAGTLVPTEVLSSSVKSIDNGGSLQAIDAYQDGIGAEIVDKPGIATDNSAMNTLTIKFGEEAKVNNATIVDQVIYGNSNPTSSDLALVGKLTIDGASCNDGNAATSGETWLNGSCQGGVNTNGTSCNDGNSATYADVYTNGVCAGFTNGTTCNDGNALTYADKYTNGICAGVTNGTTCNDSNALTYGDIYTNGVCAGFINGTTCNDGNSLTYLDKYTNGICAGIANGTTCNDNNAATTNDIYTNGICAGMLPPNNTCEGGYGGNYDGLVNCPGLTSLANWNITGNNLNLIAYINSGTFTNVDSFSGLTGSYRITFTDNPALTNLNGLRNLKAITNVGRFYNTPNLNDISGLSNIDNLPNYVQLDYRNYAVKISATSYICQNATTKIYDNTHARMITAAEKSNYCY
jgi:hypothetical protein